MCSGIRVNHRRWAVSGTAGRALDGHTFRLYILFCVVLGCWGPGCPAPLQGAVHWGSSSPARLCCKNFPISEAQGEDSLSPAPPVQSAWLLWGRRSLQGVLVWDFNPKSRWSSVSEGAARQDRHWDIAPPPILGEPSKSPWHQRKRQLFWMELCILGSSTGSVTQESEHGVGIWEASSGWREFDPPALPWPCWEPEGNVEIADCHRTIVFNLCHNCSL